MATSLPWIDLPVLAQRLAPWGIVLGQGPEPLDFQPGSAACGLASCIQPAARQELTDFQPSSAVQQSQWPLTKIAMAAAGHLAELGLAPLFLVPPQPWAALRIGSAWPTWRTILNELKLPPVDVPSSGQAAIELFPGRTPLPRVINLLLGNTSSTGATLAAEAPLLATIRGGQGITWRSVSGALLPKLEP